MRNEKILQIGTDDALPKAKLEVDAEGNYILPGFVDPHQEWVLSADNLKSHSDYSIYEGRTVKGKAIKTFVRGKLVAEDGHLVAETPLGEYVYPLITPKRANL